MRIFASKTFRRFQRREDIPDAALVEAVDRAGRGLVDANLGGGLIKQRVARKGQGRSGGYRTILAFRAGERSVFLYGFGKSERDNIDDDELRRWRITGRVMLEGDERWIEAAIGDGHLVEVFHD
jgi:hypothetical protein